jgi:hypothetical protein
MTTRPVYRYEREKGRVTHSLTKPNMPYTERVRIIADNHKVLTQNGNEFFTVIDTDTAYGWYEVDMPIEYLVQSEFI